MLANFSCASGWIKKSEISRSGLLDHRVLETPDGALPEPEPALEPGARVRLPCPRDSLSQETPIDLAGGISRCYGVPWSGSSVASSSVR